MTSPQAQIRELAGKKPEFGTAGVSPQINSSMITVYSFTAPSPPEPNKLRAQNMPSYTQNMSSMVSERYLV